MYHFFTRTPLTAPGDCHWKGGKTFLDKAGACFITFFFQLVFWFISKMTIYRHISSFADLLMFKTPRAIHPFLHGKPFAWYTYEKFAFLCAFCSPLYFFSKWYHCTSFKLDLLFVSCNGWNVNKELAFCLMYVRLRNVCSSH